MDASLTVLPSMAEIDAIGRPQFSLLVISG